jgi:hypothetical protein
MKSPAQMAKMPMANMIERMVPSFWIDPNQRTRRIVS